MNEQDLAKLLAIIRGEGWFVFLGRGIHTYPQDADKYAIYAGCVELEARGLVYREINDPDHVFFAPVETSNDHPQP